MSLTEFKNKKIIYIPYFRYILKFLDFNVKTVAEFPNGHY